MFGSLRGYRSEWLRGDLIAGLTVWAVLVPESLAYASIAGVSPVVGLYAAPGALILYAALGSSRHLVARADVGDRGAVAPRPSASVVPVGDRRSRRSPPRWRSSTGIAALLAGLLRLGFLAIFISEPVIKGFIVGLALTIIIGQVPKLFGVEKGEGDFFEQTWDFLTQARRHRRADAGRRAWRSLAVVLGLRRFAPVVPGLAGRRAARDRRRRSCSTSRGVDIVGHIDGGLPSFGFPTSACMTSACSPPAASP